MKKECNKETENNIVSGENRMKYLAYYVRLLDTHILMSSRDVDKITHSAKT